MLKCIKLGFIMKDSSVYLLQQNASTQNEQYFPWRDQFCFSVSKDRPRQLLQSQRTAQLREMVYYSANPGTITNKVLVCSIFQHYCALREPQMCSFNFFRSSVNPVSNLTYTEAAKWLKKKLHNAAVFARDKRPNSPLLH